MHTGTTVLPPRGAISIDEFCEWANIGRTLVYKEIAAGRLKTAKVGRRRLVAVHEATKWLDLAARTSLAGDKSQC